ncbi:OmpA family protein [Dyadobacter psychrotolerans]|uniref:DUF937 domain-containing protein n=1 Tax=Dyadobacter psychrotolerans TaxID=2541721 RepID=A0A4R5DRG9_9BACT|nr:OmpA family protein [Dyadobacter psychrotolerans]TDE16287.1 DUF937 domain-containing protein [Dyadobacter psychrotolerans]
MSVNILNIAKEYLTRTNIEKLAGLVGENTSSVQGALGGIFPSVLAGIMDKASTTSGAGEVLRLVNGEQGDFAPEDLSEILTSPSIAQSLLSTGGKLLPMLFGNKTSDITDAIASQNGIKKSSASSLLSFAAPFLISVIGKQVKSSGMGISGLTTMLMSQREPVLSALPGRLSGVLGFSDLGDFKGTGTNTWEEDKQEKGGAGKWLIWLLLALAVLAILWGLKTCKKEETTLVQDTTSVLDSAKLAVTDLADSTVSKIDAGIDALGNFFKRKLPNGVELDIPEFGIENKLVTFIEDGSKPVDKTTWFNFDRINFETGSTKLSAESLVQTKNIAEILKAFPNTTLKIGGYTDNTGDASMNLKLSLERANAVKEAIASEGIEAKRLEAEGYGKEHPVATNDTEEGRAQNRRIAIRVTGK